MVTVKKTWETVLFTAKNKNNQEITIDLSLNYETGRYNITTPHQEMVSFNNERLEISELKMEALKSVFRYIRENFPSDKPQPKKKK